MAIQIRGSNNNAITAKIMYKSIFDKMKQKPTLEKIEEEKMKDGYLCMDMDKERHTKNEEVIIDSTTALDEGNASDSEVQSVGSSSLDLSENEEEEIKY